MSGFIGFAGKPNKREDILTAMSERIRHRGELHREYYDNHVAMGIRSQQNSADTEINLIANEDQSLLLLCDGKIYHAEDLRKQLEMRGHRFQYENDAEVIIHGYEEYGRGILDKLNGAFAFVIWDNAKKKIFGARDRFGVKPLYYAKMDETFLFGSEIKGFLPHPSFKKMFNNDKLLEYLAFGHVPGNRTLFRDVFKLPAGHYLEYTADKTYVENYFMPSFEIDKTKDIHYFVNQFNTLFGKKEQTNGEGLRSRLETDLNSRADTDHLGRQACGSLIPTAKEFFEVTKKVQYCLDEPSADPFANLLYILARNASENNKTLIVNAAKDEIFGVNRIYTAKTRTLKLYKFLLPFLRGLIGLIARYLPNTKVYCGILNGDKPIEKRYRGKNSAFRFDEYMEIMKWFHFAVEPLSYVQKLEPILKGHDDITKMQIIDLNLSLPQDLMIVDKVCMTNAIDPYLPFVDSELFHLARTMPAEFRMDNKITKTILLNGAGKTEQQETTENQSCLPLKEWLRVQECYDLVASYFLSETANQFFYQDRIMKLLIRHKNKRQDYSRQLWAVFAFLVWYEQYFGLK